MMMRKMISKIFFDSMADPEVANLNIYAFAFAAANVQPSSSAAAEVQPSTSAAANVQPTAPGTVVILHFG